jgi:hypothetical protein
MRGWIYLLQLLLALTGAVMHESQSSGTPDHAAVSQIQDSTILEGRSCPRMFSTGSGWISYTPRHKVLFSLKALTHRATELRRTHSNRLHLGVCSAHSQRIAVTIILRLAIYHQSARLGAKTLEAPDQKFFFQRNPLIIAFMWHPLWLEDVCLLWIRFTQNYLAYGLCPSSWTLYARKHDVPKIDLYPSSFEGGRHLLCAVL